jgi:hypothetical protein
MVNMTDEAEMVNTGRKDGKSVLEIQQPCSMINS